LVTDVNGNEIKPGARVAYRYLETKWRSTLGVGVVEEIDTKMFVSTGSCWADSTLTIKPESTNGNPVSMGTWSRPTLKRKTYEVAVVA
jgi:hypothetical protein